MFLCVCACAGAHIHIKTCIKGLFAAQPRGLRGLLSPRFSWTRMYLSDLTLNEFRNYRHLELSLGRGLFLFYGDNAQGKTNLLEAVGMLATGSSFHAASDREVVNWQAPDHIARLNADVKRREDDVQIEIVVFDPTPPPSEGEVPTHKAIELPATAQRKRIKVNTIPRKIIDLIGQMKVVLFAPTDLHLVDGSPEERRRLLDRSLC